ncbi:MAG: DUF6941 family protein [Candidatus Baltobacteraceae bacterium]
MTLQYIFLCERAILTNGKLNVVGLMEQIALSGVPATIQRGFPLVLAILWKNVATNEAVTLRLCSPSGESRDFTAPPLTAKYETQLQVTDLCGLTLTESGTYTFNALVDGRLYGAVTFEIVVVPSFGERSA